MTKTQEVAVNQILSTLTDGMPQWASFNMGTWAYNAVECGELTGQESRTVLQASFDAWMREHDA